MIIDESWWKESGATSGVGMVLVVTLYIGAWTLEDCGTLAYGDQSMCEENGAHVVT